MRSCTHSSDGGIDRCLCRHRRSGSRQRYLPSLRAKWRRWRKPRPRVEVARAKAQLKSSLLMGLERPAVAGRTNCVANLLAYGRVMSIEELTAKRLDAVDAAAVRLGSATARHGIAAVRPWRLSDHCKRLESSRTTFSSPVRSGADPSVPRNEFGSDGIHARSDISRRGKQPVIKGDGVYLRYPRVQDFFRMVAPAQRKAALSSRRGSLPGQADELTKGAFRRRLKTLSARERGSIRLTHFLSFAADDNALHGWLHIVQCPPRCDAVLRARLLGGRAVRTTRLYVRRDPRPGAVHLSRRSACTASRPPACRRTIPPKVSWSRRDFVEEGHRAPLSFRSMASGRTTSYSLCWPMRRG
jgi:hypothetical protein